MKKFFLSLIIIVMVLIAVALSFPIQILFLLTFGWVIFLINSFQSIELNIGLILFSFLLITGFILVFHLIGKSWYSKWNLPKWEMRWTASFSLLILISFCAGISVIGIFHQFYWMSFKDPKMVENYMSKRIRQRIKSKNNMKLLGLAAHNFHSTYNSFPVFGSNAEIHPYPSSWETKLLPFMEQKNLYNRLDFKVPWDHQKNKMYYETVVPGFIHPAISKKSAEKKHFALSHYSSNGLLFARSEKIKIRNIKDGLSNTIMGGEISDNLPAWGKPGNWRDPRIGLNNPKKGFHGPLEGFTYLLLVDGTVRMISNDIDPEILKALSTPDGGEENHDIP